MIRSHGPPSLKRPPILLSIQFSSLKLGKSFDAMPRACQFIINSKPQYWANSLFPGVRWGIVNNKLAERWNAWIKEVRSLPMMGMIESIRVKIITMMSKRCEESRGWTGRLCPKIEEKLQKNHECSRRASIIMSMTSLYEVQHLNKRFALDFERRECTCKKWQLDRIPCMHACACIESRGLSLYDFCDVHYKVEIYQKAYQEAILPIPTCAFEQRIVLRAELVNPPQIRRQLGRRKRKPIPSRGEILRRRCKSCGRAGHNR